MLSGRRKHGLRLVNGLAPRRGKTSSQSTSMRITGRPLWSIGRQNQPRRRARKLLKAASLTLWVKGYTSTMQDRLVLQELNTTW